MKIAFHLKTAFSRLQANEAETLIGPDHKSTISTGKKNKKSSKLENLEIYNPKEAVPYNFDFNLYSIKKNISVWCIDIALLTSNGQTLKVSLLDFNKTENQSIDTCEIRTGCISNWYNEHWLILQCHTMIKQLKCTIVIAVRWKAD